MTGPERDGLIQLTRDARQPGWWHSFRDVLPNPYEVYIGLEAGAASIRNFEPVVVPGLLQTADYAREIFRNGPMEMDHDEVSRRVEVRYVETLAGDIYLEERSDVNRYTLHLTGCWPPRCTLTSPCS